MPITSVDDPSFPAPKRSNWKKPSKAVIAFSDYHGCVLWTAGPHLDSFITEGGSCDLSFNDLGLDPPEGISVWEGVIETEHIHTQDINEYDSRLVGSFREPTDDEWAAIRRGKCPWDESDWDVSK